MTHHPTWREIRAKYLSDPEVAAAYEELHLELERLQAEAEAERARRDAR